MLGRSARVLGEGTVATGLKKRLQLGSPHVQGSPFPREALPLRPQQLPTGLPALGESPRILGPRPPVKFEQAAGSSVEGASHVSFPWCKRQQLSPGFWGRDRYLGATAASWGG